MSIPIGLLPDYPLWDWAASNGGATEAQTQAAYTAITSEGLVKDFSRLVWNDIIDLLNDALTGAGLAWDAAYTTAEGAKLSDTGDGTLTAAMFNSAVYNLDRINPGFLWVWDKTRTPGYTGRLPFTSDEKVYGWYFEELALVLNIFIALLRGDENYVHFLRCVENIEVPRKSVLLPAPGDFAADCALVPVATDPRLRNLPADFARYGAVIDVTARGVMRANLVANPMDARLIPVKVSSVLHRYGMERLQARALVPAVSRGCLEIRLERYFSARRLIQSITRGLADAKPVAGAAARSLSPVVTRGHLNPAAVLWKRDAYIAPAVSRGVIAANTAATPRGAHLTPAVCRGVIEVINAPMLSCKKLIPVAANAALCRCDMEQIQSGSVIPVASHGSLEVRVERYFTGWYLAQTTSRGNAAPWDAAAARGAYLAQAAAQGLTACYGFSAASGRYLTGAVDRGTASVLPATDTASGRYLAQTAARGLAAAKPAETSPCGTVLTPAVYRGAAVTKPYTTAGGSALIGWAARGCPVWGYPADISGQWLTEAVSRGMVTQKAVETVGGSYLAQTTSRGLTGAAQLVRLSARSLIHAVSRAAVSLTAEESGDTWYDPIQTGTEVYIRSAYPQWQEGTEVRLDSGGVFYEAEQTGTEVYIRSIDSMKEVVTNA